MRITLALITVLLLTGFLISNSASQVLGSARINKRHNFSVYLQFRTIEHHSHYKGTGDWRGDPYERTANDDGIKYSYGFFEKNAGVEFGIKIGNMKTMSVITGVAL